MNLHEYQGKQILKSFGVAVPEGIVIDVPGKAVEAAKEIALKTGTDTWAVKAQIHAGGRGKGGGVKIAKSLDDVKDFAKNILGMNLVTPQTGAEGKTVHKVLIEQGIYYADIGIVSYALYVLYHFSSFNVLFSGAGDGNHTGTHLLQSCSHSGTGGCRAAFLVYKT